jgi:hypothetical protein
LAIVWRSLRTPGLVMLATVSLCGGITLGPAHATILLFDQERNGIESVIPTTSGGLVPDDYGDNVTGSVMAVPGGFFTYGDGGEGFTPDVTVDIFADLATETDPRARLWQNGYGDLVNVVFAEGPGTAGSPGLNVRFTASPGYVVDLYGFELAGFGADYTIASVQVLSGVSTLFSAADVLVEGNATGPQRTTFAFDTPLSAAELLVRLDLSNIAPGVQDNIGIDSIRFGQTPPRVVPEPATAVLLLLGGLALGLRPWVRWSCSRRTGACQGR